MSRAIDLVRRRVATQSRTQFLNGLVLLWIAFLYCGTTLTVLSLLRYNGYNASMLDLGNMSQAVASVLRGEPLSFTYVNGSMSRLSLHVELFYYAFVPFYALWPDPRTLLIGQALLFVLGVWPTYRLTLRRTNSTFAATCVGLIYLFYPTAQTSVLYDFHGDTLALPLLMFMLDAFDAKAWRRYWLFLFLALSCKFYVALSVVLFGLLIWFDRRERTVGIQTVIVGLCYGALAFFVIRPLFTTAQTSEVHKGIKYLSFYFGQVHELFATAPDRLLSAIVVFGPALWLIWRGWRWLMPGLPIAAAALLSTGPGGSFDYRYHHFAIVVPFIIMAGIEGIRLMQMAQSERRSSRNWRGDVIVTVLIVLIFNVMLVDTPLNPLFWTNQPGLGRDSSVYGVTPRDAVKDRFLAENIPPAAPVAVSVFLAPHLVDRDTLYLVRYPDDPGGERLPSLLPQVDYVLPDALFDWRIPTVDDYAGGLSYERSEMGLLLHDPVFGLVAARDGLLLFQKHPDASRVLTTTITTLPPSEQLQPIHRYGDGPLLLAQHIEQLPTVHGERRLRVQLTWSTARPLKGRTLVAVSRLAGVPDARFVHLPSYVLLPVDKWQPGDHIQETFDVSLPSDVAPGSYSWYTAWYDATELDAAATDSRSRFGDEIALQTVEIK